MRAAVNYFVNPTGREAIEAKSFPVPVGTIIVKEKMSHAAFRLPAESSPGDSTPRLRLEALAAMIKREPGYDPGGGDWEYVYVPEPGGQVTRGTIANCKNCHARKQSTDFLYLSYLGSGPRVIRVLSGDEAANL